MTYSTLLTKFFSNYIKPDIIACYDAGSSTNLSHLRITMTRFQLAILMFLVLVAAQPVLAQEPEYALGEIVVTSDRPGVEDVTNISEVTAKGH
jgi:hypothetical protein